MAGLARCAERQRHDASAMSRVHERFLGMAHGFGIQHRLEPEQAPDRLFAEMMQIFARDLASA